jgi:hypothetical protein
MEMEMDNDLNDLAGFDNEDEGFFANEEVKIIESNPHERHVEDMKTKRPREKRLTLASMRKPRESFRIGNKDVNFADIMVQPAKV